jgi:chemotaxis protein MotB
MERRNRPGDDHPNHERWLVSYADFITLMFAFFVVMFASSQADKQKIQSVSEAVSRALAEGSVPPRMMQIFGGSPKESAGGNASVQGLRNLKPVPASGKLAELTPSMRQLTAELQDEIRKGKLQISLEPRGLVISLKEAAFFPSGDAAVALDGYGTIAKLADTISKLPNPVRLEGHTDGVPIHNERFASNWALSAARSIAMLELLRDRFKVPPERMAVVGYADTIAVDTNETAEGRAKNRRVDVTILNEAAAVKEPQPFTQ